MSKLVITTVGTDIISKILAKKIVIDKQYIGSVEGLVDGIPLDPKTERTIIDETADKIIKKINDNAPYRSLPAEIASLMAFKNDEKYGFSDEDKIELFYTHTEDGKFCANINKKVLTTLGWCEVPEPTRITGLKTKTTGENGNISENFKNAGLNKLNEKVENLLKKTDSKDNYFNITGGFKAVIPYSTIIAFNNGMQLIYLYERSDDLIFIRRPEEFNCSFEEVRKSMEVRHRERLA